eukprot:TRINITY_DN12027_c1_g2_i2.p1 TRINITY_DN12027_c1_g2~~TRINITY_DN12027_c1_g2_i2.p1  ORF type:complete len:756 (-),score=151.50 TRINITY_DN12027_c1_g2_i2:59-2203(-)
MATAAAAAAAATMDSQSSTTCEDDPESPAAEDMRAIVPRDRRVRKQLRAFAWPFLLGTCVEALFCYLMCLWSSGSELRGTALDLGFTVFWSQSNLELFFWGTFITCLAARICVLFCWCRDETGRFEANSYAAVFMFFSATQWVFYLAAYYWLYDQLTYVERTYEAAIAFGTQSSSEAAVQDCLRSTSNRSACAGALAAECRRPFAEGLPGCVGHVMVAGQRCCVEELRSLSVPLLEVGLAGRRTDIGVVFMLERWLSVLVMSWFLVDNPLLPPGDAYRSFTDGVWLDVLDAVVFGDYVLHAKVRGPSYGLGGGAKDPQPLLLLWRTWLLAFLTSVLAPIVYRACSPSAATMASVGAGERPAAHRSLDQCTSELIACLRHLDRRKCRELLDEALTLQHRKYVEASCHDQPVEVSLPRFQPRPFFASGFPLCRGAPSDASPGSDAMSPNDDGYSSGTPALLRRHTSAATYGASPGGSPTGFGLLAATRPGLARWKTGAVYEVSYEDGHLPATEEVHLRRLAPDLERHGNRCGPGCCSGWLRCGYLGDTADAAERFERRARLLDSLRSLCFLEVPFLLWRLYFEWDSLGVTSFAALLIAKNFIWAIVDFLTILACGNESATVLAAAPIQTITHFLRGTSISTIWVGPAGVFMLAAQMTQNAVKGGIEEAKARLDVFRTWMLVERAKAGSQAEAYDREIQLLEEKIAELESAQRLTHT